MGGGGNHLELETEISRRLDEGDHGGAARLILRGHGVEIFAYLAAVSRDTVVADEVFSAFSEDLWRGLPGSAPAALAGDRAGGTGGEVADRLVPSHRGQGRDLEVAPAARRPGARRFERVKAKLRRLAREAGLVPGDRSRLGGAWMRKLKVYEEWDPLRGDPRFQELLRRANIAVIPLPATPTRNE